MDEEEFANSTVTLIQGEDKNIVVDPRINRKELLDALSKEGLTAKDINYVILTHNHLDH
ncbi:MAG TPA: hypothetical protein DEP72_03110 [Clostridiales bacterium]|nr:hypothetical protein [Clostridiales bacterium]